jgi:hypothetical protein
MGKEGEKGGMRKGSKTWGVILTSRNLYPGWEERGISSSVSVILRLKDEELLGRITGIKEEIRVRLMSYRVGREIPLIVEQMWCAVCAGGRERDDEMRVRKRHPPHSQREE